MTPGTLFLVATPIGNLEDITYRAVRILGEVDVIACEDTRHSRILLDRYGIHKPLVAYYREREAQRTAELMQRLKSGESVALITDAGTPLVSDPGARLVAAAVREGITLVPIPGPSAAVAAATVSGLDGPALFVGFLPPRSAPRRRALEAWLAMPVALIAFESPHRLVATLSDLCELMPADRPLIVTRELTKIHEEVLRGTAASAQAHFAAHPPRGEFTLVIPNSR